MKLHERVRSFGLLGERLRNFHEEDTDPLLEPLREGAKLAAAENQWFIPEHIRVALRNLGKALEKPGLDEWISAYAGEFGQGYEAKTIGVVMAGNIPAAGFHDFLCVLISGNKLIGRLSSADARLIPAMAEVLYEISPEWRHQVSFSTGTIEGFDAIIATGSDNTSRYFDYYFGKYPNIIRRNRNSVAILSGREDDETLGRLADDIMLYFGMGCRSVSKIYIPMDYDLSRLIRSLEKYRGFMTHNKYHNNYDYAKAVFLVNQVPFTDAGFLLLREDTSLASRIAVLNYERYSSPERVTATLQENRDRIQCIVSEEPLDIPSVKPGTAQQPSLRDYADGVDTLAFIFSLPGSKKSLEIK